MESSFSRVNFGPASALPGDGGLEARRSTKLTSGTSQPSRFPFFFATPDKSIPIVLFRRSFFFQIMVGPLAAFAGLRQLLQCVCSGCVAYASFSISSLRGVA